MSEEKLKETAMLFALKRGGEIHFPDDTPASRASGGTPSPTVVRGATMTDEVRGVIAIWAISLLTVLLLVPLAAFLAGKVSVTDLNSLIQAIFSGTAGIIGAVLGFYFSGQQAKTALSHTKT